MGSNPHSTVRWLRGSHPEKLLVSYTLHSTALLKLLYAPLICWVPNTVLVIIIKIVVIVHYCVFIN